jgi:hypothetical protein
MIEREVALPTIGLIAGTRAALGVGIGLLLADRLTPEQRRAAGWALVAIGALTTIPLVVQVLGSRAAEEREPARNGRHWRFQRSGTGI